jgi:Glycosyltransferase like family 2
MDALLIPCFRRPELLHETLKNLVATGDMHTVHVIFKPDSGYSKEIHTVIDAFSSRLPSFEVAQPVRSMYPGTKQSQNLLHGYVLAAKRSTGLVFMVEEDVQVSTDFFRFNRAVMEQSPEVFAVISRTNTNRNVQTTEDPSAYYLSTGDYSSIGVCMHRDTIANYIAPHATGSYFRNSGSYCSKVFPNSGVPSGQTEQDGLIRRIQIQSGRPTAYPHVPRCFHAGWYGYNRPNPNKPANYLSLEAKIKLVQDTIYSPEAAQAAAINPGWYQDSIPTTLNLPEWTTLRQIPA